MRTLATMLVVTGILASAHAVASGASDLFTSPVARSGKEFSCLALAPGTGNGLGIGVAVGQPFVYCKITVDRGHKKDVRGSCCLRTPLGTVATGREVTGEAR